MPHRRWDIRISDILESLDKIRNYTTGLDYHRFQNDSKTVDAVVRNLDPVKYFANHDPAVQQARIDAGRPVTRKEMGLVSDFTFSVG